MRPEESRLERDLSEALGARVVVAIADEPAPEQTLSAGEREILASLRSGPRIDSWLRGRAALKRLLERLARAGAGSDDSGRADEERIAPGPGARDLDTSILSFPHPCLSLTHSGPLALAAGSMDARASGLGVDLERPRTVHPGIERFFLGARERAWLRERPAARLDEDRLRLWTVKESLFKANLANRGTRLSQYATDDPEAWIGRATCRPAGVFRYATLRWDEGFVTLAVRLVDLGTAATHH